MPRLHRRAFRALSILALLVATDLCAQVNVKLQQPPPNQLKAADLWRITLTNTTKEPIQVYLYGTVAEEKDGQIVDATTAHFSIKPGLTTVTAAQISPIRMGTVVSRYQSALMQTGQVPSGVYTACVHVRGAFTDEELGSDCIEQPVELVSPPVLILPGDGDEVNERYPAFTWQPPIGVKQSMSYAIKIVEILGNQSGFDAMEKNAAHFETVTTARTILSYPASGRAFTVGRRYAWRVSALSGKNVLGESEVWDFTYLGSQINDVEDIVRDIGVPRIDPCMLGNWSFETGTLCRWHPEGAAFTGAQPVRGNPSHAANGNWTVSTTDAATGSLRSDTFELEFGYVRFLIGGGSERNRAGIELHVIQPEDVDYNGPIVMRAWGSDRERMEPAEFDVRRYQHMRAYIRIVDAGTGPMGHVNADHFEFTDEPLVRRVADAACDGENWGFDRGTLDCWRATPPAPGEVQNAFMWQPVRTDGRERRGAPTGSHWVNTQLVELPAGRTGIASAQWLGSLTSNRFAIMRRYITFQLGGGFTASTRVPRSLRVELLVADSTSPEGYRARRTELVTGGDRVSMDELRRVAWSVGDLSGQQAIIRIVDSSATGYVAFDDVQFTDVGPGNWDFEQGLDYWTGSGSAFREQPTVGVTVPVTRARPPGFDAAQAERLGGDYWNTLTHLGHHLDHWIGTTERRQRADQAPSIMNLDTSTGRLISHEFDITTRYVTFLVGGSNSDVSVVLLVDSATASRRTSKRPRTILPSEVPGKVQVLTATPAGSDILRRVTWDVQALRGGRANIVITDNSRTGHINVDDFTFVDTLRMKEHYRGTRFGGVLRDSVRDAMPELWGWGDFHAHPMTHLGFGGLLHGEPSGAPSTALRACDGFAHGNRLMMPLPGTINTVRTIASLLIPFPISSFVDMSLPGEADGRLHVPALVLQAVEHNHSTNDGHRRDGMPGFNGDIRFTGEWNRHVERGWPSHTTVSHQQMYRDWMYRAWQGGFRVMCALGLNNELLSASTGNRQRDSDVLVPQMNFMKAMARENSGWMEIAYTSADARRIIADGKLCVVLGIEYDRIEDFFPPTGTIEQKIEGALDRLTREGVRHIFPIHLADNVFGGYDLNKDLLNLNSYYLNGRFSDVRDGEPHDVRFKLFGGLPGPGERMRLRVFGQGFAGIEFYGNPRYRPGSSVEPRDGGISLIDLDFNGIYGMMSDIANDEPFRDFVQTNFRFDALRLIADLRDAMTQYGRFNTHVNALGLTDAGRTMLRALMRRGLLIDIDHMSALATDTALGILERNNYPVISGHNDYRSIHTSHRHEGQHTDEQIRRIAALGSTAGSVGNIGSDVIGAEFCQGTSWSWLKGFEYAMARMIGAGIGIGTDMNGFLGGPGPRFGPQACQSRPFENAGDVTMHRGVLYTHYSTATVGYPEENVSVSVPLASSSTSTASFVSAYRWQRPMVACTTGARTFDFNTDGLAHIGLVPDMLQDCKNLGMTPIALRTFMGSAEAFVRTWEKAEARGGVLRTTGARP